MLCGIADSFKYFGGIVLFIKSAYGAGNNALTATDACLRHKGLFESGRDVSVEASVKRVDNADTLFVTSRYATTAKNTFVVVADERRRACVKLLVDLCTCVVVLVFNSEIGTELLKLAALVSYA